MKIVDLSSRAAVVEEMDRLDSPPDRLYRTLTQFQLVNRIFSRYRSVLTRSVLQDMAKDSSRSYRLADLGAGGCDIARWLVRRCRKLGRRLAISAVEHDSCVAAPIHPVAICRHLPSRFVIRGGTTADLHPVQQDR